MSQHRSFLLEKNNLNALASQLRAFFQEGRWMYRAVDPDPNKCLDDCVEERVIEKILSVDSHPDGILVVFIPEGSSVAQQVVLCRKHRGGAASQVNKQAFLTELLFRHEQRDGASVPSGCEVITHNWAYRPPHWRSALPTAPTTVPYTLTRTFVRVQ